MTDLVTRLRAEVDEDVNEPLDRLLEEVADRIARLEMSLVELSHTSWPRNVDNAEVLTLRVRALARRALREPTDDKINEAFKRATDC